MGKAYEFEWFSHDLAFPLNMQVYDYIEFFSGEAWVTRTMACSGKATAKFDILLGQPGEGKQDVMDLTTPAGFWPPSRID